MNVSKNALWISIALVATAGIAFAAFDTNSPWHDLANIATDSTGTVSIDADADNVIDNANAAQAGPLRAPDFQTNWLYYPIGHFSPSETVIAHNLGGDANRYYIQFSCKGGTVIIPSNYNNSSIVYWRDLNETSITIVDYEPTITGPPETHCDQYKLRIWRY